MAKITNGHSFGLTARQTAICKLLVEGVPEKEILTVYFGITSASTPAEKGKATRALRSIYKVKGFEECYRALVREMAFGLHGKATDRLACQIDNKNQWLANKAANDVLNRFGSIVMGGESTQVRVVIEGMPTLGMPAVTSEDVDSEAADSSDAD